VIALAACSDPGPRGEIVVAVTVDWEGAYVSPEGIDAIEALRASQPGLRVTHFVSAAYFTKSEPPEDVDATLRAAVQRDDELAVHLHGWTSLARAAGIEPRTSPSFMTGTDQLIELEGDAGLDLDLDAYPSADLRALVRTTRDHLARTGPVSTAFRAGGYLGTPRMLQAIRDEGFTIDSSAIDPRSASNEHPAWTERLTEVWPTVERTTQPFAIALRGGSLIELPIALVVDNATVADITGVLDAAAAAHARAPERDVFVVLALHHETCAEHASRLQESLAARRSLPLAFATITQAGARARASLDQGRQ
jgi:hypothetical protein